MTTTVSKRFYDNLVVGIVDGKIFVVLYPFFAFVFIIRLFISIPFKGKEINTHKYFTKVFLNIAS